MFSITYWLRSYCFLFVPISLPRRVKTISPFPSGPNVPPPPGDTMSGIDDHTRLPQASVLVKRKTRNRLVPLLNRLQNPFSCHSERAKPRLGVRQRSCRPGIRANGASWRYRTPRRLRHRHFQGSRSYPVADGHPDGARASCPQRGCNCGAKSGQDARAPGYLQTKLSAVHTVPRIGA